MSKEDLREYSPLGGTVTREGKTVEVFISRENGSQLWTLEVEDWDGSETCWDGFATDKQALQFLNKLVDEHGMALFMRDD